MLHNYYDDINLVLVIFCFKQDTIQRLLNYGNDILTNSCVY